MLANMFMLTSLQYSIQSGRNLQPFSLKPHQPSSRSPRIHIMARSAMKKQQNRGGNKLAKGRKPSKRHPAELQLAIGRTRCWPHRKDAVALVEGVLRGPKAINFAYNALYKTLDKAAQDTPIRQWYLVPLSHRSPSCPGSFSVLYVS